MNNGLTEKQNKILDDVYKYNDSAEISDSDRKMLAVMFDKPEKLALLRRILGIFTRNELGLLYPHPDNNIEGENNDDYRFNHKLATKSDEIVRLALANLYLTLKNDAVQEKTAEFEKENKELKEKEDNQEKDEEVKVMNIKGVGENL